MKKLLLYMLLSTLISPYHCLANEALESMPSEDTQEVITRKKCKKFKKVTTCYLNIKKSLTLNGATTTTLGSLIPFASGVGLTNTFTPFTTSPIVVAFGNSFQTDPSTPPISGYTKESFTVPLNGTINFLQASIDTIYSAIPSTDQSYTFTLYISPSVNGPANAFTASALTATATYTAGSITATGSPNVFTAFGSSGDTPINVSAGDRVVLVVTPNANNTMTDVSNISISAGAIYLPS